jgi:pyridoxal phosphate enzyme (YggS family)
MSLRKRIDEVNERISSACIRADRPIADVKLIAVTKYVGVEETKAVFDHGLGHIGENRWQNAKDKWEHLNDRGTWHFIGHLQTNKVRDIIGKFEYIHSLDRLALAEELERKAASLGIHQKCFIQLNVSGEESKYGLAPDQLFDFVNQIKYFQHIQIVGLMTMAPYESEAEATRPVFRELRKLRDDLNASGILTNEVKHLSMGMSGDFEVAIEEGATWIRVGSAIL